MVDQKHFSKFAENLAGKGVVLDTSSLLISGVELLDALPSCSLVIPAIVVKELEEKRTHPTVGFQAREWLRLLESLRTTYGRQVAQGVPLPEGENITLRVEPNHSNQGVLPKHLQDGSHDSTILAVAKSLSEEGQQDIVILSNDTPMRLHATLDLSLEAVEFSSTLVSGAKPFDGRFALTLEEDAYLTTSQVVGPHGRSLEDLVKESLGAVGSTHAYVVADLPGNTKPVGSYIYSRGHLKSVPRRRPVSGIVPRTAEQDVAVEYMLRSPEELPLVSIGGGAGTGKTLMSLAAGLEGLKSGVYQRLIVFRSLHEMGQGQEMGFLPGDVNEKMEAWAGAVYDAIDVIAATSKKPRRDGGPSEALKAEVKRLREMVEVSPITYLRGRSLSNSYIILDEAQNFSRAELLNILSRVGEGSKLILVGDPDQVDNRYLQAGSKADVWSVIESLKDSELFAHLTLKRTERSKVAELSARLLSGR